MKLEQVTGNIYALMTDNQTMLITRDELKELSKDIISILSIN